MITALRGAWSNKKKHTDSVALDAELSRDLIAGGVGGIAWNSLKHCQFDTFDSGMNELKNTYQSLAIIELRDQSEILSVGRRLQNIGITPLTFKGRALSSYYSPSHIRPTGDLDIIVPEDQFEAAFTCLKANSIAHNIEPNGEDSVFTMESNDNGKHLKVDLHRSLSRFGISSTQELFNASVESSLPDPSIFRMPCLEHHIRIVTIHFLRHGGWRPLWLCDIAAIMDAIDSEFDWSLCLGENRIFAEWIVISMKLAEQMLHAKTLLYPTEFKDVVVPNWVSKTVSKELEQPNYKKHRRPKFSNVNGFRNRAVELRLRWPTPLVAMTSENKSLLTGNPFKAQSTYFWKMCRRSIS